MLLIYRSRFLVRCTASRLGDSFLVMSDGSYIIEGRCHRPDIVGQISFSAATWKASSFFPDDEPIECNFHKHPRNLSAVLRALPPIISSRCRSSLAPRPSFNGIFISRIMSEEIGTHPRRNGKLGGERKGRRDVSRSYDPRGEATVISRIRIR